MAVFSKDLGIDLGTVNVLVCEGGEVVLHEPTVVAIALEEQKIVAIGQEEVARCYDTYRESDPELSGRITARLTVASFGTEGRFLPPLRALVLSGGKGEKMPKRPVENTEAAPAPPALEQLPRFPFPALQ